MIAPSLSSVLTLALVENCLPPTAPRNEEEHFRSEFTLTVKARDAIVANGVCFVYSERVRGDGENKNRRQVVCDTYLTEVRDDIHFARINDTKDKSKYKYLASSHEIMQ